MFNEDAGCDRLEGGRVSRMRLEVEVDVDGEEGRGQTSEAALCLWTGRQGRARQVVGRDLRHMRGGQ